MKKLSSIVGLMASALISVGATGPAQAESATKLVVQSAWPLKFPASGRDAKHFSESINQVSNGSIKVKLYDAKKLVPSLEIFDAVRSGRLDAGYTSPLYVAGKFPAVQLFGGVPFGPSALDYLGWIYNGGGLAIWREIYDKQGVITIPCGLMEAEAGGWYKKPINSLDDIKGLKLRFSGLAGKVMKNLGASVVLLSGGDIFPNLERGVIDGSEFSMPAIDKIIGFDKIVKNYYLPGWHQPAAINELIINKKKWQTMSASQHALIELTCRETMLWGVTSTQQENAQAVEAFKKNGVKIRQFSPKMLTAFEAMTKQVMAEQSANNADFKRTWDSLSNYRNANAAWAEARR